MSKAARTDFLPADVWSHFDDTTPSGVRVVESADYPGAFIIQICNAGSTHVFSARIDAALLADLHRQAMAP